MITDTNTTPTLEQVIRAAMEGRLTEVHTALPGEVLSYDATQQTASIQLSLQRKFVTGELVKIPVLNSVPVVHPRTAKAIIHLPIQPGDHVLVVFSERSLDIWKSQGGHPDPQDPRKHHYADAVAIPGLYPLNEALQIPSPEALTVLNGKASIELGASGTFKVQNLDAGVELLDLLGRLVQAIIDARTVTLNGPQPLLAQGSDSFPSLKSKIEQLKG